MNHRAETITTYTKKDVVRKNNELFLRVEINNTSFNLPIINVGSKDKPEYIAIINPNNPKMQKHGAEVIAKFLKQLNVNLVLSAPSLKSEGMVKESNEKAGIKQEPLFFIGGSQYIDGERYLFTRNEVQKKAQKGNQKVWIEECRPITLAPNDPSKFFAINEQILETILRTIKEGKNIAIVDDVYSSGATIESLKNLISRALTDQGIDVPNIPVIVIAREDLEINPIFNDKELLLQENQALNLIASILIPVLLNNPQI